jgi:hypothetical protein
MTSMMGSAMRVWLLLGATSVIAEEALAARIFGTTDTLAFDSRRPSDAEGAA